MPISARNKLAGKIVAIKVGVIVAHNVYFEIAYAGSKITHVGIPDTNINQLTAEQLKMGTALLQRVANPYFGQIPRSSSLGDPRVMQFALKVNF
jgi:molybdopterin-binding protein